MTFEDVQQYLDRLGEPVMRLDLRPTQEALELLGRPDRKLRSVIVAGTNGKGSTASMIAAIGRAAGLRVGLFTSPHLESVTERIAIDGAPIDHERFGEIAGGLKSILEKRGLQLTYFEFLTLMAVEAFVESKTDLCVFEVGLGGRLDSANALERIASVVTRIDYDHMHILGDTLPKIAREKMAICRSRLPAVISSQAPEVEIELQTLNQKIQSNLVMYGRDFEATGTPENFDYQEGSTLWSKLRINALGSHQIFNAATAIALVRHLPDFQFSEEDVRRGLAEFQMPGRLECWRMGNKEIWLDVAHNPGAATAVVRFFQERGVVPVDIVIGMLKDKAWREVLKIFSPIAKSFTLCRPASPRAWEIAEAKGCISRPVSCVESPVDALNSALRLSDRVLCTGSFYTVGTIRKEIVRNCRKMTGLI